MRRPARGRRSSRFRNWLSHLELDWDSPVWRHWLTELSREHTLVRYDERGCGLSDWDVPAVVRSLGARSRDGGRSRSSSKRFPLLGISQGASIAITYAVRHPERVSHLILHGGYARGSARSATLTPQQRKEAEMMVELAEMGWGKENPAFRQFFTTQFIPDGTPEQHRWFNELERVSTSPQNAAQFFRIFQRYRRHRRRAAQSRCPALVLHPDRDARVPFDEGRLLASLIPGARFVPLASRNHILLEARARLDALAARKCARSCRRGDSRTRFPRADATRARAGRADRARSRQRADRRASRA